MIAQVNGVDIFYEDNGTGPAIVLLHGNGEDHTIFDKLTESLADRYRVIAVDSRDHGLSTRNKKGEELHYSDMAEDIVQLIEQLQLEKPALYGFSDGGILGLLIAEKYPGLLNCLMVSGANTNPKAVKFWLRWSLAVLCLFTPLPKLRMMLREPQIDSTALASITIPVLVLAGQKDLVLEADTRLIAGSIPRAILQIVPGEGHGSYIVHSEKLHGLLAPFLSEHCGK